VGIQLGGALKRTDGGIGTPGEKLEDTELVPGGRVLGLELDGVDERLPRPGDVSVEDAGRDLDAERV
jgi:hypothetical protein